MEKFIISGGRKIAGRVDLQSAKNSILPLIAASIIKNGKTRIKRCPKINDVLIMCEIIKSLGGSYYFENDTLCLDTANVSSWILPSNLTSEIRASLFIVGALICRFGYASIRMPGGCNIGDRPIDIHIDGLRALGVNVVEGEANVFYGQNLTAREITLRFPSVGATENLMMASLRAKGVTVIKNCAKEPEIVDLQKYLNMLGAKIMGAGSDVITIEGGTITPCEEVEILPTADRIELGTLLYAVASVGGELEIDLNGIKKSFVKNEIFKNNACKISIINDNIYYIGFFRPIVGFGKITTGPYPEFPTDLQPQLVACSCIAKGITAIEERVFPQRFAYVEQLKLFGAKVGVYDNLCLVEGGKLHGAKVTAGDLRGGASLIIGAISAEGESEIRNVSHVDRGYYKLEEKLSSLGVKIKRERY